MNPTNGGPAAGEDMEDVDSAGVGFGTKLSYDMFSLVASGFYGTGMGMRAMHGDYGAIDRVGKPETLMVVTYKVLQTLVKVQV